MLCLDFFQLCIPFREYIEVLPLYLLDIVRDLLDIVGGVC